ncbi:hypothetical protein ACFY97_19870 [Streptomyces klenkii]|uniref:hypothetical protein n=1 Tax=Streptomyces klenkii TaxID=1420899 RepID=UPI0011C44543|nr:hypothetical protein [Streptomyces klenkii]
MRSPGGVLDRELSHRETDEAVDGPAAAAARRAGEAVLRHPGGVTAPRGRRCMTTPPGRWHGRAPRG